MEAIELRQLYIRFFEERGHRAIPAASLLPENDSSVLFTTAGMHPLVPFLLGEPHPQGKRLVNFQKCIRTNDIEEVGDLTVWTGFGDLLRYWPAGPSWLPSRLPVWEVVRDLEQRFYGI